MNVHVLCVMYIYMLALYCLLFSFSFIKRTEVGLNPQVACRNKPHMFVVRHRLYNCVFLKLDASCLTSAVARRNNKIS